MIRRMDDDLGPCTVCSNGVEVESCVYADTETGKIVRHLEPLQIDENGKPKSVTEFLPNLTIENQFATQVEYICSLAVREAQSALREDSFTSKDLDELRRFARKLKDKERDEDD